mmetsp:Transcript_30159/g.32869  ORF Transcript_30159/g.32869 Transcript_30159/m.32869 type:complete len:274 (-) Transcript_30159:44-865(-)
MGNSHAPPPVDFRVERCLKRFKIPPDKLDILWQIFNKFDRSRSGNMPLDDLFDRVIIYPRSELTDSLLGLIDTKSDSGVTFGEFVELVCTIAFFERKELLRYFFYILDPNRTGLVEKHELKHFIMTLFRHQVNTNVKMAFNYLEEIDDDGTFNFNEVKELGEKYPYVFYPVYQLQTQIIARTLGEYWWEQHKASVSDEIAEVKRKEIELIQKKQKDAVKALESMNEEIVKKRMGVKYYLMPWARRGERVKIQRIAAIEGELDQQFNEVKKKKS